jgi:uncharacterized protein YcbK (DUF882 family)
MGYFSDDELRCKCGCGQLGPNGYFDPHALTQLNKIREAVGFPLAVASAYRCANHPIEADKIRSGRPVGAHTTATAVDIGVSRKSAHRLLQAALSHNCPRIGVNQRGSTRFIHLDWAEDFPQPTIWSY